MGTPAFADVTEVKSTAKDTPIIAEVSMDASSNNKGELNVAMTPKAVTAQVSGSLAIKSTDF